MGPTKTPQEREKMEQGRTRRVNPWGGSNQPRKGGNPKRRVGGELIIIRTERGEGGNGEGRGRERRVERRGRYGITERGLPTSSLEGRKIV